MGLLQDLLKEVPLSSILRERVALAVLDSPDDSRSGANIRVFPAFLQDSRWVPTATRAHMVGPFTQIQSGGS